MIVTVSVLFVPIIAHIYKYTTLCFTVGFSFADQIITTNLSVSYPFISWPGNVTIDCALEQQNIIFECIALNCFHPPVLFIGESRENAVDYHADHDCIWGRPPSTTREEGIWILHKTLSVEDIINASATVNIQPRLMRVWCDTGDDQTEKGYIHMNLPPEHSTTPPTSIPATSLSSETAINDTIRNSSSIVSLYHKRLLILSVIIVIGVS